MPLELGCKVLVERDAQSAPARSRLNVRRNASLVPTLRVATSPKPLRGALSDDIPVSPTTAPAPPTSSFCVFNTHPFPARIKGTIAFFPPCGRGAVAAGGGGSGAGKAPHPIFRPCSVSVSPHTLARRVGCATPMRPPRKCRHAVSALLALDLRLTALFGEGTRIDTSLFAPDAYA